MRWARKIAALVITCAGKYHEEKIGGGKSGFYAKLCFCYARGVAASCSPSTRRWLRGARAPSRSSGRNPLSFPNDSNNTTCAFQKNGIVINPPRGSADKTTVIRVAAFHFLFAKKRGIIANIFILGEFLTLVDRIRFPFIKKLYFIIAANKKRKQRNLQIPMFESDSTFALPFIWGGSGMFCFFLAEIRIFRV